MKLLWIDTETTGTNPEHNALIQLAGILEEGGEVLEEFNLHCRPHKGALIEAQALEVHGIDLDTIHSFPSPTMLLVRLLHLINTRFDAVKPIMAGFNVKFDVDFLFWLFKHQNDGSFFKHFSYQMLEVRTLVSIAIAEKLIPCYKDLKLGTLCKHFDIEINAHDALSDIQATRELYYKLLTLIRSQVCPKKNLNNSASILLD